MFVNVEDTVYMKCYINMFVCNSQRCSNEAVLIKRMAVNETTN